MPSQTGRNDSSCVGGLAGEVEALKRELALRDEIIAALREALKAAYHQMPDGPPASSQLRKLCDTLLHTTATPGEHFSLTRQFHRRLRPEPLPEGFAGVRIHTRRLAPEQLGGDFFDYFDLGNSCLALFIGDVSSAGLTAALIMTIAKMSLRQAQFAEYSPSEILVRMNRELCRNTLQSQFMTAFLAIYDSETNRLKYSNAAHHPPILYSRERLETLDTEGPYCGMFPDSRFEEKSVVLTEGDHLLLFTDGLVDAFNARGERYTASRLLEVVSEGRERDAADVIESVAQDLYGHLGQGAIEEDATLIGIDVLPREVRENCVSIPTEPKLLSKIEDAIQAKLAEHNYGERAIFAVRLAVEEAIINAMKHGNKMDKAKTVTVRWWVDDLQATVSVEDEGEGFDPESVPDATKDENLETPHGRGLVLMKAYMDEVNFSGEGNCVTMVKKAPWRE